MGNVMNWPPGPKCYVANGYTKDVIVTKHHKDTNKVESRVQVAVGGKLQLYGTDITVSIATADGKRNLAQRYKIPHSRSIIITENGGLITSDWSAHWKADKESHKPNPKVSTFF